MCVRSEGGYREALIQHTKKDLKNSHLCLCVPKTNIHTLIYQVIVIT